MRSCGHPILINNETMRNDTRHCPVCRRRVRFDGMIWQTDTIIIGVETELVEAVHREIVDDSTFNEALRTILVERGAVEERP